MKHLGFLITFLLFQGIQLSAFTVADVKVSKKAESAGVAREQALEEAHRLAFQKLIQEKFPDKTTATPPQETLMNMVTDFSIDREKTTPTDYAASMTFQFDAPQIQAWVQQNPSLLAGASNSPKLNPFKQVKPIKIAVSYSSHAQWKQIKKVLENIVGHEQVQILNFSSAKADLAIYYAGDNAHLEQALRSEGLTLTPKDGSFLPKGLRLY